MKSCIKSYLLAGVSLTCLLAGSAVAADMPVKARPVNCTACDWTGFYFGVNAGGAIGHDPSNDALILTPPGVVGAVAPGVANPVSNTSFSQSPSGALGGFQAGYNWQTGHTVLGAEVDWDATSQKSKLQINNFIASSTNVAPGNYTLTDEQKIGWLSTVRGRIGAAYGYTLWYVTGGLAWGEVKTNSAFQGTGAFFATAPAGASFNQTRTGFAVGGGAETSLGGHWSAKIEYLYVDLGSVTNSYNVAVPGGAVLGTTFTVNSTSRIHDNIVRAGLNYRFAGEHVAQATPGPCPTCSWAGFYLGGNAGGSIGRDSAHENVQLLPPTANAANVTNPLTDVFHVASPAGGLAGGQIGYNWQKDHTVLGVEADWDWSGQRDSFANQNFIASTVVVEPATLSIADNQKIKSLATARARLGWADNCFLWYVTGGVAWGRVQSDYALQGTQLLGAGVFGTAPFATSTSTTKAGWTVGGGVETSMAWLGLSSRWSGKVEYLYVDLGSISNTSAIAVTGSPGIYAYTSTSHISDNIIRVGVNYHFGT